MVVFIIIIGHLFKRFDQLNTQKKSRLGIINNESLLSNEIVQISLIIYNAVRKPTRFFSIETFTQWPEEQKQIRFHKILERKSITD